MGGGGDTPQSYSVGTQDTPQSTLPMSLQKANGGILGGGMATKPPPAKADPASNLMKALKQQNEQTAPLHAEVDSFLDSCGGP